MAGLSEAGAISNPSPRYSREKVAEGRMRGERALAVEMLSSWIVESRAAPHPPLSPEYRGEGKKRRGFNLYANVSVTGLTESSHRKTRAAGALFRRLAASCLS